MDFKFFLLSIFWLFFAIFSLSLGRFDLSLSQVFLTLIGQGDEISKNILFNIRIPRVLISSICGGVLALGGLCLQGLLKNPLVDPKIIGVSTGAAFGGCLAILLGFSGFVLISFAFTFGIVSIFCLYFIARFVKGFDIFTLILSGIVVNGFFAALISLIQYVADNEEVLPNIIFWLLGSFVNSDFDKFFILLGISVPCILILFLMRWNFNLLSLEEKDLLALGKNVKLIRTIVLIICTLMIATQVSVSGNIGWIGLIVPHISRTLSGTNHIKSLPYTFIVGMIFMLLIDNIARTLTTVEIPLGILSALVGTPIFAYLLRRNSARS